MDAIQNRLTTRRIIYIVSLIIVLVAGFLIYTLVRNRPLPVSGTLYTSDIVTSNTETPVVLDGDVSYFTGSNQAVLSDINSGDSEGLFSETAFESPRRAILDSNGRNLLVSVNYSGTSDFFQLPGAEPGIRWIVVQKSGDKKTLVQPFAEQILDATIEDGVVYGLKVLRDDTTELFSFDVSSSKYTRLNNEINSNTVIGATSTSILTRNTSGDVFVYSLEGEEITTIGTIGSASLDIKTNSLVISDNREDSNRYKIASFDAQTGKKRWDVRGEYKYVSVSGGYIVLYDKNIQPDYVVLYNLETSEASKYTMDYTNERITSPVASFVVLNGTRSELMMNTSNNELLYVSQRRADINKVGDYSVPSVEAPEDDGVFFESSPGSLDITIIANTDRLQDSARLLGRTCDCNHHEFRKAWLSIDEYNRPAETRDDEFTGDGAPPELQ